MCVINGPGRGECWSCPVVECLLWENPVSFLTPASREVALKAADRLMSGEVHVTGTTGWTDPYINRDAAAMDLLVCTSRRSVQTTLVVRQAAEAIYQNLYQEKVDKTKDLVMKRWLNSIGNRAPTPDENADLDESLEAAEAAVVAAIYNIDHVPVLAEIRFLRGRKVRGRRKGAYDA